MNTECEITVNGKHYVSVDSITDGTKRIVILQRGWCMVGDYSRDGESCILENASVIRRWGTTNGLGEIAQNGPTDKTKLDPCGTVRFNVLTTVAMMDCNKDKWI